LRNLAEIATIGWDYGQSAIVATIAHERDHHGRAEQHFLPADLRHSALRGRRSSIVWSEPSQEAKMLMALAPTISNASSNFASCIGSARSRSLQSPAPSRWAFASRAALSGLASR